MTWYWRSQN